ncbi:hypothetical protein TRFO_38747 [Tritrichomonas foetus]|uniref:Uncharacterized protein n=1 Tax=Tritrichomonas foetus TaxID=1144522 RepID=A0A1J4J8N9_9EUKA|nr:hypothetical protein TRFO_38747 [Tritrichomonas foetus]|eukprot:OHS95057.1 hypothetical protein TRFO_38747 [Tritrichomonas foetus]
MKSRRLLSKWKSIQIINPDGGTIEKEFPLDPNGKLLDKFKKSSPRDLNNEIQKLSHTSPLMQCIIEFRRQQLLLQQQQEQPKTNPTKYQQKIINCTEKVRNVKKLKTNRIARLLDISTISNLSGQYNPLTEQSTSSELFQSDQNLIADNTPPFDASAFDDLTLDDFQVNNTVEFFDSTPIYWNDASDGFLPLLSEEYEDRIEGQPTEFDLVVF